MEMIADMKEAKFRPGDLVTVRSVKEIASTLDGTGTLEGLPFLPEMLKYCGRTFRVQRRVEKLIQENSGSGLRRMKNVVVLNGPTCDGKSHNDCQRACFPLWKTAWLSAVSENAVGTQHDAAAATESVPGHAIPGLRTGSTCQVTELTKATAPLSYWHPLRFYLDLTSNTYSRGEYLRYILGAIHRKTLKKILAVPASQKPAPKPSVPSESLELRPGDLVEVKSAEEIRATLDEQGKTRGLLFMPAQWAYCGRQFRVLKVANQMMDEHTGEMVRLKRAVLLEGTTCDGKAYGGCQRGCLTFWKEAWLRRVEDARAGSDPQA